MLNNGDKNVCLLLKDWEKLLEWGLGSKIFSSRQGSSFTPNPANGSANPWGTCLLERTWISNSHSFTFWQCCCSKWSCSSCGPGKYTSRLYKSNSHDNHIEISASQFNGHYLFWYLYKKKKKEKEFY